MNNLIIYKNEVITLLQIVELIYKIDTKKIQNNYQFLAKQITSLIKTF
ncbi:MAG: hypothetical protein ACPLRN_04030 [Microgenomates group bacterium]